ncbi:MAG: hypothetical protein HC819_12455 [Cyclobacteriaceae bacterium]|nr:hypothetical protein [Cyclobacteriaceae bacterium]
MLVPFEELEPGSKIWIYTSEKALNEKEINYIIEITEAFLKEWTAHGNSLQAAVKILHHRFIILGVNEAFNEASGCSIDKSVAHFREVGRQLNIDLLQRSLVAFREDNTINLVPFSEIKQKISAGEITGDTEVFNHAVVSKAELETSWVLPARSSWVSKYFQSL